MRIHNLLLRARGHVPGGFRQLSANQQVPITQVAVAVVPDRAQSVQLLSAFPQLATVSVGLGTRRLTSTQQVPDAVQVASASTLGAPVPGTVTQLGTNKLIDFVIANRSPADITRLYPGATISGGLIWYCGMTLVGNYLSLGQSGGHSGSFDNSHFAQNLVTGAWEQWLGPSAAASTSVFVQNTGEFTGDPAGRPASSHSGAHVINVNGDVFMGYMTFCDWNAGCSSQAFRWNAGTSSWSRYGNVDAVFQKGQNGAVFWDQKRNRIIRWSNATNSNFCQVIADNNPNATWTSIGWAAAQHSNVNNGIYASDGYSPDLDCYVHINPRDYGDSAQFGAGADTRTVYVMLGSNVAAGWTKVTVSGVAIPFPSTWPGCHWVAPMGCFVVVNQYENNKLYYLKPDTLDPLGSWTWTSETFTSTGFSIAGWDNIPPDDVSNHNGIFTRIQYSPVVGGLVALKSPKQPTEVYVPRALAAYNDWIARSTAAGVVAAYDFSQPPANGGTWQFGSTSASPKTTVWGMNNTDPAIGPNRFITNAQAAPGSTRSLQFYLPPLTGERADAWRISIDNYADQFGENDEFWFQMRMRMDTAYAQNAFTDKNGVVGGTDPKLFMVSAGMQTPYVVDAPSQNKVPGGYRTYYGYSPGANEIDNVIADARIDSAGELVVRTRTVTPAGSNVPFNIKYPWSYVSKNFADTATRGQDQNYATYANEGNEAVHVAACQWINSGGGSGDQYTDYTTCAIMPVNSWFTMMYHVKLGPWGTAVDGLTGNTLTGYTQGTLEIYIAFAGQKTFRLLHRRTNVVFVQDGGVSPQGQQKYGQFGLTTFMTNKSTTVSEPASNIWYNQVIVRRGATPIPCPQY